MGNTLDEAQKTLREMKLRRISGGLIQINKAARKKRFESAR
jgi:hypothetical protein